MASQTLVIVVLPAGRAPGGKLRANVYVTPRLSGAPILSDFDDWYHWPDLIAAHGLELELTSGAHTATVAVDRSVLRPDAWHAIFPADTHVADYPQPQFSQRLLVSYPTREAYAFLKFAYQFAAVSAGQRESSRLLQVLLGDLVFRDGRVSTLDGTLSQLRVDLWNAQQHTDVEPGLQPAALPHAPDGAETTLTQPAGTRPMVERFALYHHLPKADGRPPLPSTPEDWATLIDFHKAVSSLHGYPELLKPLGLVFEVLVPASLSAPSPGAAADYATVAVSNVTPGWTWSDPPQLGLPATAYVRDASTFAAAPATSPGALASLDVLPADVVDGFLALVPGFFQLLGVDVDGALLKALALADNVANVREASLVEPLLPSLRSGGIALIANDRAQQLLEAIRDNEAFDAAVSGGGSGRPLTARDLVRGYRLDVWSSQTSAWHSLHRRDGVYRIGAAADVLIETHDEEGFTQLAVVQPADDPTRSIDEVAQSAGAPQPSTDLYVHERVARWNGWGLSAPRPGTPLNRSPDPARATDADPTAGQPITPFKMTSTFAAHPGTLPRLRFGARYRLRARAVDLAGHSVDRDTDAPQAFVAPPDGQTLPYLRYEPVPPPAVVLRALPGPGGSHAELVIRSRNSDPSLDHQLTGETDERHIGPPRAAVLLVEHHGMLDDDQGHLRPDVATYDLVVDRDQGDFPRVDDTPIQPGDQLDIPYFPDPLARGAAFVDLPNTPDDTTGRVDSGVLSYVVLPDVETRPGSVTQIDFGPGWLDRRAFRIRLAEGRSVPVWDDEARVLTVFVPKAGAVDVGLSSFVTAADLELLGVWNWMRELFDAAEQAGLGVATAGSTVVDVTNSRGLLTRQALEGGQEMLTPTFALSLVHAVQQPLGRPAFSRLPIVHQPGSPIAAESLSNAFSPITAWRSNGSHHAVLLGALQISGKSTASIDLEATWTELVDDPDEPAPRQAAAAGHVERITLTSLSQGDVPADGTGQRLVAVYLPTIDVLWFAAPFDQLQGVTSPPAVAAPVHQFGDTKHRRVCYRSVASSRFQEYFTEPDLVFTRTGNPLFVDVPSSARPAAPEVLYVVPTFGWERQETSNVKTDVRFGNGLRVYLDRPWYSSGEGELLGVVLWPGASSAPDDDARETAKALITQWGLDPIWQTGALASIPSTGDLTAATKFGSNLTLEKSAQLVDVAGHEVGFDPDRRLWYCDVVFDNPTAYMPFVRLALARYQPRSIPGVELSQVVLADFAQLTPDRAASLAAEPLQSRRARLVVGGLSPQGPTRSFLSVSVEARIPGVSGDLGWQPAEAGIVTVTEDSPAPDQPDAVLWAGTVEFAKAPAPGQFRVVVREYEIIEVDPILAGLSDQPTVGHRLVYASILPFDFPAPDTP